MARVVSVSRRTTHLIDLQRQGFEVVDLPSGSVPREQDMVDSTAVLLDVGDLERTQSTLRAIRALDEVMPVVVLAASEDDWTALESDGHTLVVVPPVTFDQVAGALRALDPPEPVTTPVESVVEAVSLVAPAEPAHTPDQAPAGAAAPVSDPTPSPAPDLEDEPVGTLVTVPAGPRLHRLLGRGGRGTVSAATSGAERVAVTDWRDAAAFVVDRLSDVPDPAEASDALAQAVCEVVDADAVAVLCADGERLRVSGGVGLRPIETRLTLGDDDWLVSELHLGLPVVSIPDTDARRAELAFTPLARKTSLLAVLLRQGTVLAVAGRNSAPFESDEVADVLECLRREVLPLGEALEARDVARALARFQ